MVGFNEGDEALRLYSPAFPLSVLVFVSYFYFFSIYSMNLEPWISWYLLYIVALWKCLVLVKKNKTAKYTLVGFCHERFTFYLFSL